MQGEPIPGEHWLVVDLGAPCALSHFLIDFEKAHAEQYTVQSALAYSEGGGAAQWVDVAAGSAARETGRSDQHIVHELPASSARAVGRWVRLLIHQPATHWGTSVWRFQVWGHRVEA
jgi:allantoicase